MNFMVVPSHRFASWLMHVIEFVFNAMGIESGSGAEEIVYVIAIVALAAGAGWPVRYVIVLLLKQF
mgnify:CR=1 FL=1